METGAVHTISVSVPMNRSGAVMLRALADQLTQSNRGANETAPLVEKVQVPARAAATASPEVEPKKRGRPAKAAAKPVEDDEDDEYAGKILGNDENGDLELNDDDDELGLSEPTPAPKVKAASLEDVIGAFKDLITRSKGDKAKAGAILSKFSVKSVRDLPEAKYPEIIKMLKTAK